MHISALETAITDCHPGEADSLEESIRTSRWTCASESITHALQVASGGGSDEQARDALLALKSRLDVVKRRMDSEFTSLYAAVNAAVPGAAKVLITPAFEWCQSATHIYINVKFAHKLDAPATLNVEAESVVLGAGNVRLAASTTRGSTKNFLLDFPLFAAVVPQNSSYNMASVGRMSITLVKAESPSKWPRLVHKTFNAQQSLGKAVLHFWHDMHKNYVKELELLDDEDDDEDDRKAKLKRREREKEKQEKEKEEKEKKEKEEKEEREKEEKEKEEKEREKENEKEQGGDIGAGAAAAALELDPEL